MTRPWETLDAESTPWGEIALRRRGHADFLLTLNGRVVMTSAARRSELLLGQLAAEAVAGRPRPRVLLGGLGMGYTLGATLDALPGRAEVVVVELLAAVVRWCRGPLAFLSRNALADFRVRVVEGDVAREIAAAASRGSRFDALVLDLFEGPGGEGDPQLGLAALRRIRTVLSPGGVLAVWSECPRRDFERALRREGFVFECRRAGRGGRKHAVYRARCERSAGAPRVASPCRL